MKNKEFSILNFQLSITDIRAHLCHQWGIFSSHEFHGFSRICFIGSRQCVRDWSGILLERSGKRYSGKPDGFAGTPKEIYN